MFSTSLMSVTKLLLLTLCTLKKWVKCCCTYMCICFLKFCARNTDFIFQLCVCIFFYVMLVVKYVMGILCYMFQKMLSFLSHTVSCLFEKTYFVVCVAAVSVRKYSFTGVVQQLMRAVSCDTVSQANFLSVAFVTCHSLAWLTAPHLLHIPTVYCRGCSPCLNITLQ